MIRNILEFIANNLELEVNRNEVRDIVNEIRTGSWTDFYANIDGEEYRFIHEDYIWDIYVEGIKDLTQDGYLGGTDLDKHWWIEIDWEQTAKNCYGADGYGHHFGSYDGGEFMVNLDSALYHVFRTN